MTLALACAFARRSADVPGAVHAAADDDLVPAVLEDTDFLALPTVPMPGHLVPADTRSVADAEQEFACRSAAAHQVVGDRKSVV